MRIAILGDHSDVHCGCVAVVSALKDILSGAGEIVPAEEDHDVLVVNGEGSMHDDTLNCRRKLEALEAAQECGKKTWLVNSVWQRNGGVFDPVLKRLDGLWLRGPCSAADLRDRHGIEAGWGLDLSFFAAVETVAPPVDFAGDVVVTDFWDPQFRHFVRPTVGRMGGMPYVDMRYFGWSELIASLRTSSLLITGRHHAVYAACKARTPFIALATHTHKMEDLLRAAPASIPVCTGWNEVREAQKWSERNGDEYQRLFDWMEKQPRWRFPEPIETHETGRTRADRAYFEARSHIIKGTPTAAGALIEAGLRADPTHPRLPPLQRVVATLTGDVVRSALATARDRLANRKNTGLEKDYTRVVNRLREGSIAGDAPCWHAVDAIRRLPSAEKDVLDLIGEALSTAADDVTFEAVRGVLTAIFTLRKDWAAAEDVEAIARSRGRPDWLDRYDGVLLTIRRQRYHARFAEVVATDLWNPDIDVALRLDAVEYLIRGAHVDEALIDRMVAAAGSRSADPAGQLAGLAVAAAASAGMEGRARDLARSLPGARLVADRLLSVAALQDDDAFAELRDLHHRLTTHDAPALAILADPSRTVALVGNGPAEGPPAGDAIDAHDLVVRFNDFRSAGVRATTGGRIGLVATTLHRRPEFDQPRLAESEFGVVLTHPALPFTRQSWGEVLRQVRRGIRLSLLPDTVRPMLRSRLGVDPSSGLHLAVLAKHLRGTGERLTLFHMPLLRGVPVHSRHRNRTTTRHDWSAEADLAHELDLAIL